MPSARRFTVSGRVQGVFFRASTREVAEKLGVTGYAINLDNGDVEVLACGEDAALGEMRAWLRHGPRRAVVDNVVEVAVDCRPPEGFTTG